MPARKNRPDKHGTDKVIKLKNYEISIEENELAKKLIKQEQKEAFKDHYVGWPDMHIAEKMENRGFLRRSTIVTGCFFLTDLFKRQFQLFLEL